MRLAKLRQILSLGTALCCVCIILSGPAIAAAEPLSASQQTDLLNDETWYDTTPICGADSSDSGGGEAVDAPADMLERAKTAFKYIQEHGQPPYTPIQIAGIVGNLMGESGVKPDAVEAGSGEGYGIAQWSFGRKPAMRAWVSAQNPPNNDPTKLGGQLDFLLHELQTTEKAASDALRKETTIDGAAKTYMLKYERPNPAAAHYTGRQRFAHQVYDAVKADGGFTNDGITAAGDGTTTSSACAGSDSGSPDCQTAVGTAKILCEAKKYDPLSYFEGAKGNHYAILGGNKIWKGKCPTLGPSCYLDCSGLVSIAVFDAFGYDKTWVTGTLVSDHANWQRISPNDLKPGDVVEPNSGHVEIVESISGNSITTFGAHQPYPDQAKQISTETYMKKSDNNYAYLRYIGPGAGTSAN